MGDANSAGPASSLQFQLSGIFTARQVAVVTAVCQGKANKIIAYDLKMRESTVKVHFRSIMKKLEATNHTEVAYIANQFVAGNHSGLPRVARPNLRCPAQLPRAPPCGLWALIGSTPATTNRQNPQPHHAPFVRPAVE